MNLILLEIFEPDISCSNSWRQDTIYGHVTVFYLFPSSNEKNSIQETRETPISMHGTLDQIQGTRWWRKIARKIPGIFCFLLQWTGWKPKCNDYQRNVLFPFLCVCELECMCAYLCLVRRCIRSDILWNGICILCICTLYGNCYTWNQWVESCKRNIKTRRMACHTQQKKRIHSHRLSWLHVEIMVR